MRGHNYWRVNITANNGGIYVCIPELSFLDASGNNNSGLFVNRLFSSQFVDSADNSAVAAFDGSTLTQWTNAMTSAEYLGMHFSVPIAIDRVTLTASLIGQGTYAPKNFTIDYSDDGINWTTAVTVLNQTGWGTAETRSFDIPRHYYAGQILESLGITNWLVVATDACTGESIASAFSGENGGNYYIETYEPRLANLTLSPRVDYRWSAAKVTALNDYVVAVNPDATPHIWKCTTAGTTHATEPTWNLSGTTVDNTAIWTHVAPLINPVSLGCKMPV